MQSDLTRINVIFIENLYGENKSNSYDSIIKG